MPPAFPPADDAPTDLFQPRVPAAADHAGLVDRRMAAPGLVPDRLGGSVNG